MAEPTVTLREPSRRVSTRARAMWQVSALVEGLMTFTVMAVADGLIDDIDLPWWAFALAVAVHLLWAAVVPQWRYLVHRWEVTETAVYTQTGWWARERRIAPMSRIQTVDHAEGAVERIFRLATVTVTTASAAGALRISGLDQDVARHLVDELTLKADAVEGDAT